MKYNKDLYKDRSPVTDVIGTWQQMSNIIGAADAAEDDLYGSQPELYNEIYDFPCIPRTDFKRHIVTSLGKDKNSASNKESQAADHKCLMFAGALLNSDSEQSFSICCRSDKARGVSFSIGLSNDEYGDRLKGLLDSCFEFSEIQAENTTDANFTEEWQAVCTPIFRSKEQEENNKKTIPSKWADTVAAILMNSDCAVKIDFVPSNNTWIKSTLNGVYKNQSIFARYLSSKGQLSSNFGENTTCTASSNKLVSIHKKSASENAGTSAGINLTKDISVSDPKAENIEKRLKDYALLLEKMTDGGWFIRISVLSCSGISANAAALRDIIGSSLLSMNYSCKWKRCQKNSAEDIEKAGLYLPSSDALSLISVPTKDFVGFAARELNELNLNPPADESNKSGDIILGELLRNGTKTNKELKIPRDQLNRHTFVCGMTGSGKTNTVCSLLSTFDDLNFIVIEPVKGEYHSIPNTKRFNMLAGSEHSLYMNPFRFPKGGNLQYHIDSLKLIISSAFDLYAAMPNILEQCLYRVYMSCGWDLISGNNIYKDEIPEEDLYPTFTSLCDEIEVYITEKFQGELEDNYRGALLSRLQSFTSGSKGVLLNTKAHIPFEEWVNQNIVIELDALADDADKAVVMGALLIQYFQFVKNNTTHKASDGLRHLFVLEEAHHLFQENQSQNGNGQNSSAQLVKMLNNLLAEIRAYGEGFLIVDQSPSALSPSVLKNTAVKIAHRVDYGEDIKLLESVLLLDSKDKTTASLKCGEALVRFGSMTSPSHVSVYLYKEKENCVLHGQSVSVSLASTAYDRILMNAPLLDVLTQAGKMFLNCALFEKDFSLIKKCFSYFRKTAYQLIVYHCGWENAAIFSEKMNFLPLFDICISKAVMEMFHGQYCLSKIIHMYVKRLSGFFENEENSDIAAAERVLFEDYRERKIYPRISFFYENSGDTSIEHVTSVIGSFPEAGVVKLLADAVWNSTTETKQGLLDDKLTEIFGMEPGPITKEYLKYLTDIYIKGNAVI
ncbi:MAG: ATP-binding protein [Clostridia bacterium]|nr:ATP-binding protein [Clostridia bacterium]